MAAAIHHLEHRAENDRVEQRPERVGSPQQGRRVCAGWVIRLVAHGGRPRRMAMMVMSSDVDLDAASARARAHRS